MKRSIATTIGIVIALAAVIYVVSYRTAHGPIVMPGPDAAGSPTASGTTTADLIHVVSTQPGTIVRSPLSVTGEARGTWYFEAVFPIVLTDWDGKIIAQGHAQADGDWMTNEFVPFEAKLDFKVPVCAAGADYCKKGTLILKNDNPSGDPAREKALEIPVTFE